VKRHYKHRLSAQLSHALIRAWVVIWISETNPITSVVKQALSVPGLTEAGQAWLAKALHPSDVMTGLEGVPTMEAVPTGCLNYTQTTTIAAPAAGSWNANIRFAPTPTCFAKVSANQGATYSSTTLYNSALCGTVFGEFGATARTWNGDAIGYIISNTSKYRLMYASMTVTLNASATTNEGTCTCAQYSLDGADVYPPNISCVTPACNSSFKAKVFDISKHTTSVLQQIPGSVTWEARKGQYVILKLDDDGLSWRKSYETVSPMGINAVWNPSVIGSGISIGGDVALGGYAAAGAIDTPFGPDGVWSNSSIAGSGATTVFTYGLSPTYEPCNSNIAESLFTGLDAAATLTITCRVGLEFIPSAQSALSSLVTSPIPYDPKALETYYACSRGYLSAYPAEYNILGAIWTGIKAVGKATPLTISRFCQCDR